MDRRIQLEVFQKFGLREYQARLLMTELERREEAEKHKNTRNADRNWDKLLAPLLAQIAATAGSSTRWKKDPMREPVYTPYLKMLRKVRDKIRTAQHLSYKKNQTIQEAAAERGITEMDGRKWSAWVPRNVRDAFIVAFDNLSGKHITPFNTVMEQTISDRRWTILENVMLKCKRTYRAESQAQRYLDAALTALHGRRIEAIAPIQWTHLLPRRDRIAFLAWKRNTKDGATEFAADTDTQQ